MGSDSSSGLLPFPPVVLGIAGCSGSGKTTLAVELARTLNGIHFPLDHYYRDLSHLSMEERNKINFDHPDSIDSDMLVNHLKRLKQGENIEITKRKRVIAHLLPVPSRAPRQRPDFLARLRAIYGTRVLKVSGAELLARERSRD